MCQPCRIHITTCQLSQETQCKFLIVTLLNLLYCFTGSCQYAVCDFCKPQHSSLALCCVFKSFLLVQSLILRFAWKKTSFLFRAGLANLSILEYTLLFVLQSAQQYDSQILDPLFGDEHINMFAQQYMKWVCSHTLPQTCQNKKICQVSLKCCLGGAMFKL